MIRFVKVDDTESKCDLINLEQVTKVKCAVRRTGTALNIESVTSPDGRTFSPERVVFSITLCTANGEGNIHFSDLTKASDWAKEYLGIEVSFD